MRTRTTELPRTGVLEMSDDWIDAAGLMGSAPADGFTSLPLAGRKPAATAFAAHGARQASP